jgi:hypothetical protein
MQSFSETLLYRSIPASVLIQTRTLPSGAGVEGLIDATSNPTFADGCWPSTQPGARNAQMIHGFMRPEYAK